MAGYKAVLIVDDDKLVRELISDVLRDADFHVTTAEDGPQAVALIEQYRFGVAILDKNLPGGMSGIAVLAHLQRRQPLSRGIMLTAYASQESAIEALRYGAFDYLEKPTDNELLVAKVQRAWDSFIIKLERENLFRKYETLFEIVPGIVWFMTQDGKLTRINQEGAAMLGYDTSELVGASYTTLLPADAEENSAAHWAFKERRTGERATRRALVSLVTRDGNKRVFEVSATGAYDHTATDPGQASWGTLGVGWDVTERTLLEMRREQGERLEAMGRLVGGIAHDFNNLLTVIMGNTEYMRRELSDGDEVRAELSEVLSAGDHAADLIKQLLAFSRGQARRLTHLDLGEIAQGMEKLLRRVIGEDIELIFRNDAEDSRVLVDGGQLEQVIMNLVVNSRDALPRGGKITLAIDNVTVTDVTSTPGFEVEPGRYVSLVVSDDGAGMTQHVQEHAFEPFYTTKSPTSGTGLGLATVYGIVKQNGGQIEVDSRRGEGTRVQILLPVAPEGAARVETPLPVEVGDGGGKVILLVEDEDAVRATAARILTRQGFNVVQAGDGQQALEAFEQHEGVDLVLTDVVMPALSGVDLVTACQQLRPGVKAVYMSGHGVTELEALEGQVHFIQKPFSLRSLTEAVARALADAPGR